jgi:hypothetical protein
MGNDRLTPAMLSPPWSQPRTHTLWRLARGHRQVVVIAHVLSSVGLFGIALTAVAFAALALWSGDASTRQALLRAIELLDRPLLPVLAVASVSSGVLLCLGTAWGLFTHVWIVAKQVIMVTLIVTGVFWIGDAVRRALDVGAPSAVLLGLLVSHVALLVTATALAVIKPKARLKKEIK